MPVLSPLSEAQRTCVSIFNRAFDFNDCYDAACTTMDKNIIDDDGPTRTRIVHGLIPKAVRNGEDTGEYMDLNCTGIVLVFQ
jgi:hypothetical protein